MNNHKLTIAMALLTAAITTFAQFIPHLPMGLAGALTGFMALANGIFQKNSDPTK